MRGAYLVVLIVSLLGLGIIDRKYRLAYFFDKIRTLKIVALGLGIFIIWDVLGILARIFYIGETKQLLGVRIGDFPLEEIFFLLLLIYSSLITYRVVSQIGYKK